MKQQYETGDFVKIKSNGVDTGHRGLVVDVLSESEQEPLWSKYLIYVSGKIGEFHHRSLELFYKK